VDVCDGKYADIEYRCYPFAGIKTADTTEGDPTADEILLYSGNSYNGTCWMSSHNSSMHICNRLIS